MSDERPLPLDTNAYLADTGHLSTLEHGAYCLILMAMWRSKDGCLAGDDHYLARATRMTLGRWKRIAPTIRALLKTTERGKVTQKRLQKDRAVETPKVILGENQNLEPKSLKNKGPTPKAAPEPGIRPSLLFEEPKIQNPVKTGKGQILPESWRPSDQERLYGRTVLRLTDAEVDRAAEKMRRWALSNRHRAVARKSDWDLTFRNWLDDDAERKHGRGGANQAPRPTANGAASLMVQMIRDEQEKRNGENAKVVDVGRALPAGRAG